jgi:transcription antitermination factor NusG
MNNSELSNGDAVEVTKGLWKGVKGTIEDVHKESSVVRIKDERGETAYALKEDVKRR